jgi:hypothetical protein
MISETEYAPVIITTLNRYDKLRSCLESLSLNSGAEKTDIYISLDYPPSEKYWEGYKKNKEYLSHIDDYNYKFHKVEVICQEKNLGPFSNMIFLYNHVKAFSDIFITTEDDNIFSPCFLDYMNKGLKLFRDNPNVAYISGYRDSQHESDEPNNVAAYYNYSPWGTGGWFGKQDFLFKEIDRYHFREVLRDKKQCLSLFRKRSDLFRYLVEAAMTEKDDLNGPYRGYLLKTGELAPIDFTLSIVMNINNMYTVVPSNSLVRNIGVEDGTGNHTCRWTDDVFSQQQIETNLIYEYKIEKPLDSVKGDAFDNKKISSPEAKRAWVLRKIYILFGTKPVKLIMKISYSFSKFISKRR